MCIGGFQKELAVEDYEESFNFDVSSKSDGEMEAL